MTGGYGRLLRKEDQRFVRGQGFFVDDVRLPGMLYGAVLRSPHPHARIKSIDATKAWDIPGVHLVLTGEMMATRNLAWMPTLSYDTQAVLATDKVRFQALLVSIDLIRACASGLRRISMCSMPGREMSSTKTPWPRTNLASSLRGIGP